MHAVKILAGAANPYNAAARTRRVSTAGLAFTSGEIVTQIQLGGSRTGFAGSNPTCPATQSPQTGGPQKKNSVQRAPLGEPFLALRMCRRPAAARAASAGRPLLHDRSVLRHARIADRICRRSCLHDCTPLHAASDVSDVLSPLTVACFRRAAPPGALRRLGGDPVLGIGLSPSTLLVRERRPVWRFILWSFTDEPRRNGGVVLSH